MYICTACDGTDTDCTFNMAVEAFEEIGECTCDSCYESWLERDPRADVCGHDEWLAQNGY